MSGVAPPPAYSAAVGDPEAVYESLTERQRAVLDLLIQHHTTKEIARKLGISPNTVDQRILAAREKLGASDRKETARCYVTLLELCGKSPCEFPLVDFHDDLPERRGNGPSLGAFFALEDSLTFEGFEHGKTSNFRPETLDARFGKLWRIAAIPVLALLTGTVLISGLAIARALGELI